MELCIVSYIYIDIFEIIEDYFLNKNSSKSIIMEAITNYVAGLDDCDYYLIGDREIEKIYNKIYSLL